MPFFSVIVPLYNKENYVENTLKSILNQTYIDYEILIINDCSTDKSVAKVSPFLSEKIILIHQEKNKGLSAARNTGIKNSKSDYVVFLDADDLWKPTFLETIKSLIDNFEEAALFGTNYEEIYANEKTITTALNLNKNQINGIIPDFFEVNLQQPIYCPSSLCVLKKAIESIGFYDETITYSEDIDFDIRANLQFKLAYSCEVLVQGIKLDANRITNNGLKGKKIPDLDSYEVIAKQNESLKKYLDLHRYIFAKMYKKENDLINFKKLKNGIDPNPNISGLNFKQRILLQLPTSLLSVISKLKLFFQKKGMQLSSFS